jgi:rfaE bifunctional protein kinase chain/domain
MSEEDPTIVVTPIEKERFVGGAGIVAAHAQGLGAKVNFFSVTGTDEAAEFAKSKLQGFGVDATLLRDDSRPTTLKQRYRSKGKTLLRVSHLRQHDISKELISKMDSAIDAAIGSSDVLIFSDFNYGCLPQTLVESITARCKKHGVMMVADSQSSSQVGDVSRFKGMALLTPTERETRLALRDFNSGLVILADKLQKEAKAANVVITLGSEGLLVYTGVPGKNIHTDRLPAMNTAARDPAGAGDSLLTTAALALATGANIWLASYLGALAAACQVGRIGNLPLTPKELHAAIEI